MLTRIITGLGLIAATIAVFGFLRIYELTLSVVFAFIAVAGAEFLAMTWSERGSSECSRPPMRLSHWVIGLSYSVPMLFGSITSSRLNSSLFYLSAVGFWCAASLLLVAGFLYRQQKSLEKAVSMWLSYLAGFVYIALPGAVILSLSTLQAGSVVYAAPFWFAVAVVYMGDTGAYFTGVSFGKHKLIPGVSPKKTWEGSLGGLAWSAATALVLNWYWGFSMPVVMALSLGILAGVAGQIGDLVESALKRIAGCKDSGRIFPGHGGVLDRIDSLLFAAPICYGFFVLFGIV
jgi:phosphatidate cytidylyltransferase